jgi:hypothetical protein
LQEAAASCAHEEGLNSSSSSSRGRGRHALMDRGCRTAAAGTAASVAVFLATQGRKSDQQRCQQQLEARNAPTVLH